MRRCSVNCVIPSVFCGFVVVYFTFFGRNTRNKRRTPKRNERHTSFSRYIYIKKKKRERETDNRGDSLVSQAAEGHHRTVFDIIIKRRARPKKKKRKIKINERNCCEKEGITNKSIEKRTVLLSF